MDRERLAEMGNAFGARGRIGAGELIPKTWLAPTPLPDYTVHLTRLLSSDRQATIRLDLRDVARPSLFGCLFQNFRWTKSARAWSVYVPLWAPLALSLLLTTLAWRWDSATRRRERVGRCSKCDYSLAGLGRDSVCPECGAASKVA
jgi:hypothetical protein